jgi:cobalt-zinc-cadmium efflux system protein
MTDDHSSHGTHTHGANERRVGLAALLTGAFMFVEAGGGVVAGSLALLADAGHMVADFASLALAWYGFRLSRRPADWKRTYGYDRFSVLIAFVNGIALFVIAVWVIYEAWQRLGEHAVVLGGLMFWVALAGLAANIVSFWVLQGGDRKNLNIRAAALHVLGDLLGSLAALLAAIVIMAAGWTPIDPILSVLVAVIILRSAWRVVSESGHILLEGTPSGINSRDVANDLRATFPAIADVHHVHIWSITQERPLLTLHVRVKGNDPPERIVAAVKRRLAERFNISHATIEVEFESCSEADPLPETQPRST